MKNRHTLLAVAAVVGFAVDAAVTLAGAAQAQLISSTDDGWYGRVPMRSVSLDASDGSRALGVLASLPGIAKGLHAAPATTVAASVEDLWRFVDDGSVIRLAACDAALCGVLTGLPAAQRGDRSAQSACGVQVLHGFVAEGPDRWVRGQVFDPATGGRYAGSLRRIGSDRLELQVGSGLLSSRHTLVRHSGPAQGCAASA